MSSVSYPVQAGLKSVDLRAAVELLKPLTWFPPMWAFGCGAVSAGVAVGGRWPALLLGVVVAGPMVCGASQAVNDWYDRDVDALNQPDRPIPSGRIPGRQGLYLALGWTGLSLALGSALGDFGFGATVVALLLAWGYSAPPFRFKRNGWLGNAVVGISYEGLAWITGAAVMLAPSAPPLEVFFLAAVFSLGAHGIMTLNDFKSIAGDRQSGIGSLPVRLGPDRAARLACATMLVAQVIALLALLSWNRAWESAVLTALVVAQAPLMWRFLAAPLERAAWFSGLGVTLYVLGMLVSAIAVRGGLAS